MKKIVRENKGCDFCSHFSYEHLIQWEKRGFLGFGKKTIVRDENIYQCCNKKLVIKAPEGDQTSKVGYQKWEQLNKDRRCPHHTPGNPTVEETSMANPGAYGD